MKRHSNMNELFLSPSFHQIQYGKQPRLYKKELKKTKNIYSSSYTSLSEKDFFDLQQALKTIFHYLKPKFFSNDKQRLTSPYLQERIDNNQLLFPLYTNEYFIRNGLLNHNDGPEIYDHAFESKYFKSSLSPLVLLSNQKYLFNALTSNFVSEKYDVEDIETKSMINRRNKVKTWERENILQQRMSITYSSIQQSKTSKCHCSSNNDKKISEKSFGENNIDDLFPMVKILAPYIIIRDSFHLKQYLTDKHRSILLPCSSIIDQGKKNYLLAEFESVLTEISKK